MKTTRMILLALVMTVLTCCILALLLRIANRDASKTVSLQTEFAGSNASPANPEEEPAPTKGTILVYKNGNDQLYCGINGATAQNLLDPLLHCQTWDLVPETEKVASEPDYYIDCQNGVALALISDVNQVQIGECVVKNGRAYSLLNVRSQLRVMPGELVKLLYAAMKES